MKKNALALSVILLFVLGVTACASKTPEPVTFRIEMTEYAFNPNRIEVKVGQRVTLELVNMGQLAHEIMFGREVVMKESRPSGYHQDMFAMAGIQPEVQMMVMEDMQAEHEEEGHEGFMVVLNQNGDRATITFTVTKEMVGEWEMGCFEQDGVHYNAGMKGVFVVSP